jgi:hypothetical protein
MKIVLNGCYGGFGLSYEAMYLYILAKGQTQYLYAEVHTGNTSKQLPRYKLVSLDEVRQLNNNILYVWCTPTYQGDTVNDRLRDILIASNIDREDPDLVSVVEVMGDAASGRFACLEIHEVPDGTLYKIDNYDGIESLITQDDSDWLVARDQTQSTKQLIKSIWDLIKPAPHQDQDLTFTWED